MFHNLVGKTKKEISRMKTVKLPPALKSKFNSYLILGFGFIVLSIICGVFWKAVGAILFPLTCGLILIGLGYLFKFSIQLSGYETISGTCIGYENKVTTLPWQKKKGADYFILETPDDVLKVASIKRKTVPPIGSRVNVYISKDANSYNSHGYTIYIPIYGFAVASE